MDPARERVSLLERVGEALTLALVCLSPWAFGAVEAWAELALELGIAALAPVAIVAGWRAGRVPHLLCIPGLALLGLVGLALLQATPLPEAWLRRISPAAAGSRATFAPATAVRVRDDARGPVAPPPPRP
jgi:hypothetical protein